MRWEGGLILGQFNRACIGTLVGGGLEWCCCPRWRARVRVEDMKGSEGRLENSAPFLFLLLKNDYGSVLAANLIMIMRLSTYVYFSD